MAPDAHDIGSEPVLVAMGVATCAERRGSDGSTFVFPPLSLEVSKGQLVVVTGGSRSGKTTLVNLLAGWVEPDEGSVRWPGIVERAPTWTDVAVVPQALALVDELTVAENIELAHRVTGRPAWREVVRDPTIAPVLAALDVVRLLDRTAGEISVGERQRVMVARALVIRPMLLIADEPTAHQDQAHADAVLDQLQAAVAAGAACVIATREPDLGLRADATIALTTSPAAR